MVLFNIFLEYRKPIFRKLNFALLVTVGRAGVANEDLRASLCIKVDVVEMDAEAFTFFNARGQEEMQQSEGAGIGLLVAAMTISSSEYQVDLRFIQHLRQGTYRRTLQDLFGRVNH